jgi:hypothetical protein
MHKVYQAKMNEEGFALLDYAEDDKQVFTAWTKNDKSVFVETRKIRTPKEPNYMLMTNHEDCWDGYDSFKSVFKNINNYINS